MEPKDYEMVLDSLETTGVYVVQEDNHRILYFNKRVKAVEPEISAGMICDELWPGGCESCPVSRIGERRQYRAINYNTPFGEVVDVVATRMQWGEGIPAFCISVTPRLDVSGYTYSKILKVDLETGDVQVMKLAGEEKAYYGMGLTQWFQAFVEEGNVYAGDVKRFLEFTSTEYLQKELQNGKRLLTCTYRRKTATGFRWHIMEVIPDYGYSPDNQTAMLYVRDVHDIHSVGLDREEINIQNQEIIKTLGEMNFGVHIIDLKTGMVNPVRISEEFSDMLAAGIVRWDDLLNKAMMEYFHPGSRKKLWRDFSLEGLTELWKSGESKKEIVCQRMLCGSYHYVSVVAHFYQREPDSPYVVVALQDVDERVRRDIRKGQQDRRLAAIIKSRYDVMTTIDLATGICERVYLKETNDLQAASIGDYEDYMELALPGMIHEDDLPRFRQVLDIHKLEERAARVEDYQEEIHEFRLKGFADRWMETHLIFVRQKDNVIVNLMERDITEKKRQEKEAFREKEKRNRIISSMSSLFFSTYYLDLENDSFEAVAQEEEVSGVLRQVTAWSEALRIYAEYFVNPEDAEEYIQSMNCEAIRERLTPENPYWAMEYRRVIRTDGEIRPNGWIRATVILAKEQDGRTVSALYVAQDVTESKSKEEKEQQILKEAYDMAMHANASKSEFLSRMSHDIRTPMNAIIGMTAIAQTHLNEPERISDCLGKITVSSRHLLSLINEVLDMSKIESGKIDLSEEEFNLSDLVQNLITMVRPTAEAKKHQLRCHIVRLEHEDVIGDELRLQQVFMNILGNAVKYTPPGGTLEMEIREKNSRVYGYGCYEFVFQDNGIGMSKEYLKKIFEPFSRAEDSRVSKIEGTGLGMTIALNIVHRMNGEIEIESEEGRGSRFTVTVFLKQQNREKEDMEQFVNLPVLVVDDNPDDCEAACLILQELGMRGQWVTSGSEAVERILEAGRQDRDFFAVILDWKMPHMDGLQTAREIREKAGQHVPIIILSAYDWSSIETEARQAGISDFISKPLFKSKLVYLFKKIAGEEKSEEVSMETLLKQDFTGKRVLLAEDNELNREIAEEIIGSTGVAVDSVSDGREAVDAFLEKEEGYYDLIFMDIQMPVMNGHEAARTIRSLDRPDAAQIPIIAMTANAFAEDAIASKNAGMNEHITKPLNMEQLRECMLRWLTHDGKE